MKKIVLGCAAVLLSLGLLAGCNKEDEKVGPGPEENPNGDDDGGETEAKLFKLAAYDYEDATWRYALGTNDETTGQPATTETWESAPWISAVELSTGGYALGLGEEASSFLSWSSSTSVAWGSESFAWTWDKEIGTFTVADSTLSSLKYRYLGMNVDYHDIRAYAGSNLTDVEGCPVALAVGSKPTVNPVNEHPEYVKEITAGTYNLGLVYKSVQYYFNGGVLNDYYLDVTDNVEEAVAVKVAHPTDDQTNWTLSFDVEAGNGETTTEILYAYSSWDSEKGYTHQNLFFGAEESIPTTSDDGILAVTTAFTWDETICGFTAELAKYEEEDGAENAESGTTETVTVTVGTTSYAEITVTTSSSVIPAHLYEIEEVEAA